MFDGKHFDKTTGVVKNTGCLGHFLVVTTLGLSWNYDSWHLKGGNSCLPNQNRI